jgi:hypothetical protein
MIQIETLALVLTGYGIIVSILYYSYTIRGNTITRKAQNFNQLWTANDPIFLQNWRFLIELEWVDYDDFIERHWKNYETWEKISLIWQVLNPIGIHLMKDVIDRDMVYFYAGYEFLEMWEHYEKVIHGLRESLGHPEFMTGFEYLASEMKKRRKEETPLVSRKLWVSKSRN